MTKAWATYKSKIIDWYVVQGWTAEQVLERIYSQHGELIGKRSLRLKLREWGCRWRDEQRRSGRPIESKKARRAAAAARAAASVSPNNPANILANNLPIPDYTASVPSNNPATFLANSLPIFDQTSILPPNTTANEVPNINYTTNVPANSTAYNSSDHLEYMANLPLDQTPYAYMPQGTHNFPENAYGSYGPLNHTPNDYGTYGPLSYMPNGQGSNVPPNNMATGLFTSPDVEQIQSAPTFGDLYPEAEACIQNGTFFPQEEMANDQATGWF